ncbi:MAG: hypothetical protein ABSE95_08175 [Thermodesulfobacteriota bacterium]|jgi:hypothetical protein
MRSLARVLTDDADYFIIKKITDIAQSLSLQVSRDPQSHSFILDGKSGAGDSLLSILSIQYNEPESEVIERIRKVVWKFDEYPQDTLYTMGVNLKAVTWVKGLISENHFPHILIQSSGEILFNYKTKIPFNFPNTPVNILDGTGDPRVIKSLIGREVRTVRAEIKWESERTHIKYVSSKGVLSHSKESELKRNLKRALKHISGQEVLVVTHKEIEDVALYEKIIRNGEGFPKGIDVHFLFESYKLSVETDVNLCLATVFRLGISTVFN